MDEIKELARTNKNIFSWLKPPTTHMIKVAEVVEIECQDEMENMDVVDAVWEERLEMMCKESIQELVQKSVEEAGRMLCKDLLETTLVDRFWGRLEYGQIMKDILGGESNLKVEIETGQMDIREVEEAEVAMLMRRQLSSEDRRR